MLGDGAQPGIRVGVVVLIVMGRRPVVGMRVLRVGDDAGIMPATREEERHASVEDVVELVD